jgi:hypothetical protein
MTGITFRPQARLRRLPASLNKDLLPFVGKRKVDKKFRSVEVSRLVNNADRVRRYDRRLEGDPVNRRALSFHELRPVPVGDDLTGMKEVFVSRRQLVALVHNFETNSLPLIRKRQGLCFHLPA